MKKFFLVVVVAMLVLSVRGQAQTGDLVLQRDEAGLYLTHKVAPKENFYSIGRLYNISPKVIAPFNGLDLNGGLSIGQVIKIPLKDQNFTSTRHSASGEVLVPLYRLNEGKKVVAGYLKVFKGQSSLASEVAQPAKTELAKTEPAKTEVAKTDPPKTEPAKTEVPKTEPAKTEPPKTEDVAKVTPPPKTVTTAPVKDSTSDILSSPQPQVANKKKPAKPKTVTPPPATVVTPLDSQKAQAKATPSLSGTELTGTTDPSSGPSVPVAHYYNGEGTFHNDYLTQTDNGRKTRSASGMAGVFKSTSGWDNGKFYALMNNVERGTVVKVTNLSNNKVVFVKVLSDIADIKQNSGMAIVLSDAAVNQLGVFTDRFTAELTYER
jgi:hypothetical protein